LQKYYRRVAWLNRGVQIRANRLSSIPFNILKGDQIVDTSKDYQNYLGFLPNLRRLLWLAEMGLTLGGRCYLFKEQKALLNRAVITAFRNLAPHTVTPEITEGGLQGFTRRLPSGVKNLDTDDVVYFWGLDNNVEVGEPKDYPALAALTASGVLYAVDGFATMFFERGAIKVTLLRTKGHIVDAERTRLKTWWNRIRGEAWASEIVNANEVEVVPVGEGLDSLTDTNLTTEKREDIATAIGVPHSMLFSNAANYATANQDEMNFYMDTIIPDTVLISEVWNTQVLNPLGYRLVFNPYALDIFQEDENQRSQSYKNYVDSGVPHSVTAEILGVDLPDGVEYEDLDELDTRGQNIMMIPNNAPPGAPMPPEEDTGKNLKTIDLDKWERKALKRLEKGDSAYCDFISDHLEPVIIGAIQGALKHAQTPEDVKQIFSDKSLYTNLDTIWQNYP
jgi:hypothetical protein